MNHAFLIMTYNFPEQLGEVVNLLMSENHYFFIHVDKKSDMAPFIKVVKGVEHIIFISENERIPVYWGGFSQVLAEIILLKKAYTYSVNMEYFHLISGQDFPCKSNQFIDSFFNKHLGESFMKFDTLEETREWRKKKYPNRYRIYSFSDKGTCNSFIVNLLKYPIKLVQKFVYLRPEIKDVYAGWNWFSWHRRVLEYVLKYINLHPNSLERLRYCSCMDELYFHTILHDKMQELNIVDNALRYIVWYPKRPAKTLPLVLNENEYLEIIHSDAIFCRKVNPLESAGLKKRLIKTIQNKV